MRWLLPVRAGLALLLVAAPLVTAAAQTPPPPPPPPSIPLPGMAGRDGPPAEKTGTGILSGRVVAADAGRPLRRALVRALSQELPQPRSVSTDADGRWQLKDLPAGSYRVSVSKGGYVDIAYGQLRPFEAGKVLELKNGQVMEKLDVSLPRAGVITGRVVDEFGEPVTGARVSPLRFRYVAGRRRLTPMAAVDTTDDIGQFRLHGLPPGDYFISAQMAAGLMFGQSDDRVGYGTTYFPGTGAQSDAQRVNVAIGQETANVNIAMTPSRVAMISGTATSSSGRSINRGLLMLTSNLGGANMTALSTQIKPDGSFLFSNISPGEYRIHLHYTPNEGLTPGASTNAGSESASLALTVAGADITGLSIVTGNGATASGRIVFEGTAKPPVSPAALNLTALPIDFEGVTPSNAVRIRDDWSFEAAALTDRRRFGVGNLPSGWYLKSVMHEGTDITDSGVDFQEGLQIGGIEILLTQRAAEITGSVQDGKARPVSDYVVVAFAADSTKWGFQSRFVRAARPNQDGRFSMKGMPPEEYLVVAVDYLEPGEEGDPEQLEKWKHAASRQALTLKEGEQKVLSLELNR
jgi:Carboxypeptidase regulatory-like domain